MDTTRSGYPYTSTSDDPPTIISMGDYFHSINMYCIMWVQAFQNVQDNNARTLFNINPNNPFFISPGMAFLVNGRLPILYSKSYNEYLNWSIKMFIGIGDILPLDYISPPEEENNITEIFMDSNRSINVEYFDLGSMRDIFGLINI